MNCHCRSEHPFLSSLRSLNLPAGDYVICGSGPLLAHGLRDSISDIDIVARGSAWRKALAMAGHRTCRGSLTAAMAVKLLGGRIEVFQDWVGSINTDMLIERAQTVNGLPYADLLDVLSYKRRLNREKDQTDIRTLFHKLQ